MPFTTEVKSQIAANGLHPYCMKAEPTAVLQMYFTMDFISEGMHLTVKTENANTAKRAFRFLKELCQVDTQPSVIKKMKLKRNNTYVIRVKNKAMEIFRDLEIMAERGLQNHPSSKMVRKECCARAYLAGASLAGGSVNSLSKSDYRLETGTQNVDLVEFIWKLMQRFDLPAKQIQHRNQEVVYLEAGDKISDFLRRVGASGVVFTFEGSRIQRDLMNSLTWLDNYELANETKSITVGEKQLEDIQWIGTYRIPDSPPEKLQHVACARKQLPEASLNEPCEHCAEEFNEAISKSGMKHRLAKLWELADQYRKEQNRIESADYKG